LGETLDQKQNKSGPAISDVGRSRRQQQDQLSSRLDETLDLKQKESGPAISDDSFAGTKGRRGANFPEKADSL
jgi:hypothetical protein